LSCPFGATSSTDCSIPGSEVCCQCNEIPCILSVLCSPDGTTFAIANDCSNIFATTTGAQCSEADCAGDCVKISPELVDCNSANRMNIDELKGERNLKGGLQGIFKTLPTEICTNCAGANPHPPCKTSIKKLGGQGLKNLVARSIQRFQQRNFPR